MIITTKIKNIRDYSDEWFEKTYKTLPSWRKEKVDKLKYADGRKLSILSGKMILDAFIENNEDPENVVFTETGKPMVGSDTSFFFSLSHSKDVAALSVSTPNDYSPILPGDNRIDATTVFETASIPPRSHLKSSKGLSSPSIGVDIEYIREYDEMLAKRFFTSEEQDYLNYSKDKDENFTRIWTSKEAYGKFTGGGITEGLSFSTFHNPLIPLNVILPCCFEYSETMINGEKYLYTICYGVIELDE